MPGTRWKRFWDGIRLNYLIGITAGKWRDLLRANHVDPAYRDRAAVLSVMSVVNSLYARREERLCQATIAGVGRVAPPLFLLGHWRSGTTLLHNLLAQDDRPFAYPTTFQMIFPHAFLTAEERLTRWLARMTPRKRTIDAVAMGLDTPQEDEHALALLTLRSPYLGMGSFPQSEARYARYLDFRDVPESELAEWKKAFLWLVRKLRLKHGSRMLALKSPGHTARLRLLLELFPEARFVHIIRDPFEVFPSMRHMLEVLWSTVNLQRPGPEPVEERILRWYTRMYDAYFRDRALIPEGRFHEVRFEELERDPVGQLQILYGRLSLPGFESLRPKLERYVGSLSGYRKNEYPELSPDLRRRVATEWRRSFEEWGYLS